MTPTDSASLVSLRDYVDRRFEELEARTKIRCEVVDARLAAIKEATGLARKVLDARLESMNEIRAQLVTQAGTFETKDFAQYNRERIEKLEVLTASMQAGNIGKVLILIAATAAVVTLVHMLWK